MSVPVFVDTSALYAALDADDDHHAEAAVALAVLLDVAFRGGVRPVRHLMPDTGFVAFEP